MMKIELEENQIKPVDLVVGDELYLDDSDVWTVYGLVQAT